MSQPAPAPRAPAPFALPLLVLGAAILGSSGIWVRLSETGPVATGFHRMAFALPFFLAWLALTPAPKERVPRRARHWLWVALAGLAFAGDLAIWHWALMLTTVTNATLLGNTAPILVTLAAWLILRQRPTRMFVAGLALALSGAAILLGSSATLDPRFLEGDLLSLLAALFWAAYVLFVAEARKYFTTVEIMSWATLVCGLTLLPLAWATGERLLPLTAQGWFVVIAFALSCQCVGQAILTYGLAHLPAALASVTLLIQPVSAAVLAVLLLGEDLGWLQIAGGIVVLAGIYVSKRGSAR